MPTIAQHMASALAIALVLTPLPGLAMGNETSEPLACTYFAVRFDKETFCLQQPPSVP